MKVTVHLEIKDEDFAAGWEQDGPALAASVRNALSWLRGGDDHAVFPVVRSVDVVVVR